MDCVRSGFRRGSWLSQSCDDGDLRIEVRIMYTYLISIADREAAADQETARPAETETNKELVGPGRIDHHAVSPVGLPCQRPNVRRTNA